jgi:hypothetical protein
VRAAGWGFDAAAAVVVGTAALRMRAWAGTALKRKGKKGKKIMEE